MIIYNDIYKVYSTYFFQLYYLRLVIKIKQ